MTGKTVIRRTTPDDARGIAEVHVASWRAAYTGLIAEEKMAQLDVAEREHVWRNRLEDLEALQLRAWVVVLDGRVVGFAFTQPSPDKDLPHDVHELTALYLLQEVWRSGIGTALLSEVERELRESGVKQPSLWVLEGNESAKTFYEALGWKLDNRDSFFRDFGVAALRYRKIL